MENEFIPPQITDERFAEVVKEYNLDTQGSGRGGKRDKNNVRQEYRPGRLNVDTIWIVGAPGVGKTTLAEKYPNGYIFDLDWIGTKDSKGHWYIHPELFKAIASIHPMIIGVCSNWEELTKVLTPRVYTKPDDFLRAVYKIRNANPKHQGGYKFGEKEIEFQNKLKATFQEITDAEVKEKLDKIQKDLEVANEKNLWRTEKGFPLLGQVKKIEKDDVKQIQKSENEEILEKQVKGEGKAPKFSVLPILVPIEPHALNKDGNPYKLGVVKGSEERGEDPDNMLLLKIREEAYEILCAKSVDEFLYEFIDVVIYAEVLMDEASPALKQKVTDIVQKQLEKNVARGREPRLKIRQALGWNCSIGGKEMNEQKNVLNDSTKDKELADQLTGKTEEGKDDKLKTAPQDITSKDLPPKDSSTVTTGEEPKPLDKEKEKEGTTAKSTVSFGVKRTGIAGKKFEI